MSYKKLYIYILKVTSTIVAVCLIPNLAFAFGSPRYHYESLESVIQRSELALITSIISTEEVVDGHKMILHLDARRINSIFGPLPNKNAIRCIFTEDRLADPFIRDDDGNPIGRIMSPELYTSGSGIEFDVSAGDKVILFLESNDTIIEGRTRLLRIEPIGRLDQIKELANKTKKNLVQNNGVTETVIDRSVPHNSISFNNGRWNDLVPVFSAGNNIYFYTDNKFGGTAEVTIWASYSSPQEFSLTGYLEPGMKVSETDNYGEKAVLNVEQINFDQYNGLISCLQEDGIIHHSFKEVLSHASVENHFIYRIHIMAFDHGYHAKYLLSMTTPAIGAAGKALIDFVGDDLSRARVGNIELE